MGIREVVLLIRIKSIESIFSRSIPVAKTADHFLMARNLLPARSSSSHEIGSRYGSGSAMDLPQAMHLVHSASMMTLALDKRFFLATPWLLAL